MSLLKYAEGLFSLDTLDSRFTSSSKTIPSGVGIARPSTEGSDAASAATGQRFEATRSRWKSPEFAIYGFVFLFAVPLMFKTVYELSLRKTPNTL